MSAKVGQPARTLPDSIGLDAFMDRTAADPLPLAGRYQLVAAARVLLEELYVHLPLKRAMHATDPVQRLRLLERRLRTLGEQQFHAELAGTFRELRDLHTVYQLPDPYRGHVATLGFLVERYADPDGTPHHIVSKIDPSLAHAGFDTGAELEAWNGVPIERAIERNAAAQAGSNPDARLARGLEALTLRPLRTGPPPDERWVVLSYRTPAGRRRETRIPWRVRAAEWRAGRAQDPVPTLATSLGIDAGNEATRQIKRALFAPPPARRPAPRALRGVVAHRTLRIRGRSYGYLRIFSFNVPGARVFAEQLARIVARAPDGGLIVDIRGNPGGHVPAAECVLQVLSERPVTPVSFSLSTTRAALALTRAHPGFRAWTSSIRAAVETGAAHSQGFPLTDPDAITAGLPRYTGPKVLITDALSYSAADIFAAGFQDNGLGPVLGTARRTGAGGANVWTHELLRVWLPELLGELPRGAGFRVALRRATRARGNVDVPLEDLGVQADELHQLTERDVTGRNQDLLATAAALLG
ncbi:MULTISPECIES: S41 family peptidase [unclassified Streptomyces]|uniref:S41 family peptidase n=1 Tax=unclassified Streptomyces TaxID=2593676 RepID=UPI002DDA616D|nr:MULTISPECIES: S41 family peptidase [unclassified Streptomyces]WSA93613.1 S41 family peptidase [Streptomyces sp. NBC_01795]WSB77984.1 S41 family peptidase [Streptomyces sp. NBC_01775]WSS13761.1 S41 family peptidase [Streptomyces sp. NBC_01186]WSS42585.1 S41 family peptidase [Streptomyces sp. NBC_01187]